MRPIMLALIISLLSGSRRAGNLLVATLAAALLVVLRDPSVRACGSRFGHLRAAGSSARARSIISRSIVGLSTALGALMTRTSAAFLPKWLPN